MKMLSNRVAIQALNKSTSKGGFLQMPEDTFNTGRVKYVGPNCTNVEIGQLVFFGSNREPVKVNGIEFLVMEDSNIFGILDEEENQKIQN